MWSEQLKRQRVRRASAQGFSLMELMTVVIIVGVLSAVAIPSFSNYIYKSRTTEAIEFLGVIRLREESYRSEFGAYCPTFAPGGYSGLSEFTNFVPDPSTTKRDTKVFNSTQQWLQLGARPSGPVRFGYAVAAGTPSDAPSEAGWTTATADFWFVARAVCDLDGNNTYGTFEIYSPTKNVFIGNSAGAPLSKGWE
jgi:prepilin-type N-terminal cleavage/methylation domain-containing protein